MKRDGVTESPAGKWTHAEDYLGAMARKRSSRWARHGGERTEPESPRLFLSFVPFVALLGLLAILAIAIMIAAFPGAQPVETPRQPPPKELGVAAKGWFQEAQKDFHH